MTTTTTLSDRIRNLRSDMRMARSRRNRFVATYSELSAMSDYDLADIGVSRLQIRDIAQSAAYGQ